MQISEIQQKIQKKVFISQIIVFELSPLTYPYYQQQQQQEYLNKEREYFRQKQPKKYKKVVYEEESDSEPEVDEGDYVPEEIEEDIGKLKTEKKTT